MEVIETIKLFIAYQDNESGRVCNCILEVSDMPHNDNELRRLERRIIDSQYQFVGFEDGHVPPHQLPHIAIVNMVKVI